LSNKDVQVVKSKEADVKMSTSTSEEANEIPLISDKEMLRRLGICTVAIPTDTIPLKKWADELSQVTPLNLTAEDGEYAFYRNIMDEPGIFIHFPGPFLFSTCNS
jgi:hypothetical protein